MDLLKLLGRKNEIFKEDISVFEKDLQSIICDSSFLVIGGAGTIGQSVVKEIFKRNPRKLHVVDISENNIVELVRDIRSSFGYIKGDFQTFALDIASDEYDKFIADDGKYDFVLNLSALKHVRSEKDEYTLMRMIRVNIINTEKTIEQACANSAKKYFCVSTDKAANPVNLMGASKRIMELFLFEKSDKIDISTARFANVAFSDGSLLFGFNQRIQKMQPIVAPNDIKRYFITPQESGELCLLSCLKGVNRDIFFPKLNDNLRLTSFADIAVNYLENLGYEPYMCEDEAEARSSVQKLIKNKKWPCLFTESDTTGEKDFEEFYTENEILDMASFGSIGVIKSNTEFDRNKNEYFRKTIADFIKNKKWNKSDIVDLFNYMLPNFNHLEKGKYLDGKM